MGGRGKGHNVLRDLARRYMRWLGSYERAMYRGDLDRADEAESKMQELEASVTIIVHHQVAA